MPNINVHRLGHHVDNLPPQDDGDDGYGFTYHEETGMEYYLHGDIIGACHEMVGLMTYYRAENPDDAWNRLLDGQDVHVIR